MVLLSAQGMDPDPSSTTSRPIGVPYEASQPAKAHALPRRLEIQHTPETPRAQHRGDRAPALTRQRLDRRINDIDVLHGELTARHVAVNTAQRLNWQHFLTSDARTPTPTV
jgi:hypothetical protein